LLINKFHMKSELNIYYTNSWRIKPFKYGRPFVKLADYEKLKKELEKLRGKK